MTWLLIKYCGSIIIFITVIKRIFVWGATGPMPPGRCHPVDATRPMPPSLASVVYTFEALAGSWGSVNGPAVSRIIGGAQCEEKNSKKYRLNNIWGGIFNVVSLKYIGKRHLVITYTLKERSNINWLEKKTIYQKVGGHGPRGPPGYATVSSHGPYHRNRLKPVPTVSGWHRCQHQRTKKRDIGETGAGWRMGQVDFFDLSEYYWTNRTMAPSTDQRYDYAQM